MNDHSLLHLPSHPQTGAPLVYFDNGATTPRFKSVISAMNEYYLNYNANVHRAAYSLASKATEKVEASRILIQKFINARLPEEIVFTSNCTSGINLISNSYLKKRLSPGDIVVVSELEHHSNLVPWQMVTKATGATLRPLKIELDGSITDSAIDEAFEGRVVFLAVSHLSNVFGSFLPIKKLIKRAHQCGAKVLLDGAQFAAHHKIDVQELDVDFYCFSGHKMYGPTGIGIAYGKLELLEDSDPFLGGGDMVGDVFFDHSTYARPPHRFEAGTPPIAEIIGLGAAAETFQKTWSKDIVQHEKNLAQKLLSSLKEISGIKCYGNLMTRDVPLVSFAPDSSVKKSVFDIALLLGEQGFCVRSGHHCCAVLHQKLGISGTIRASLGFYNTEEEIHAFCEAVKKTVSQSDFCLKNTENIRSIEAESLQKRSEELIKEFLEYDTPDDRVQYFIERGEFLPRLQDDECNEKTFVPGCLSKIYMAPRNGDLQQGWFAGRSNSHVMAGVLCVLHELTRGVSSQEILEFDFQQFFKRLGLDAALTTQRRNGLASLLGQFKHIVTVKKSSKLNILENEPSAEERAHAAKRS